MTLVNLFYLIKIIKFIISTLLEMIGNLKKFYYKGNIKFNDIYDVFE